ncbi:general secretion pathway protein GspB [Alteromonas sp. C1M14]|uniref:general secretion pathway protein GspB n=1 Tax=Alteromonas sp. C1M14 TaxID=2841567 RepID=UPI001C084FA9|nr:general secretion pathway protein GspB [Alteromonas sp. C1M14]MBU2977801.1 general secretion pathway protein GspB [Alteromonas sp. C1M14]
MSDILDIDSVKPGMVIIQITKQNGPVKIRKSGLVTSQAMVQGLSEMGVQQVEIDPDQTVEIAKNTQYRTQTQALIRGDRDTSARALDHSISEQFNRSLFLPTVQGLPSLWKKYLRQGVSFAVVILLGGGLGFLIGAYPAWWPTFNETEIAATSTPSMPEAQSAQTEVEADPGVVEAPAMSAPTPEETIASSDGQPDVTQPQTDKIATAAPNSQTEVTITDEDVEGEILNAPPEDNVEVSPELMARFNQAIAELDNKATDEKPDTQVTVRDTMPRVDQLPVRMLTRLPSMSFSAHMYASRASDRWVRVNGQQLTEGDWIGDKVQIVKIEAQRVILSFEGKSFSMAALTDW